MRRIISLSVSAALMAATGVASAAAPAQPAHLPLADLPAVLAATGARPSQAAFHFPRLGHAAPDGQLLWVTSDDLASSERRRAVGDALSLGESVLVTSTDRAGAREKAAFGYAASEAVAVYRRAPGGALEVLAIDDALSVEEASAHVARWVGTRSAPTTRAMGRSRATRDVASIASARAAGGDGHTPSLEIHVDKSFPGGRRIYHHIEVLRDVTPSRDDKVVIVKTQVNQAPSRTGTIWNGSFAPGVKSYHLLIPDTYRVRTDLELASNPSAVTLQEYAPLSDGVRERTVNTSISIKASSGVSAPVDILSALASAGAVFDGKLPVTLSSGKERMETESITMVLKDYTTRAIPDDVAAMRGVTWSFPLAVDIASDIHYFEDGQNHNGPLFSEVRTTPMMKTATLESVSTWRIHGDQEGDLLVTTHSDVTNRFYDSLAGKSTTEADPDATVAFTTRIPLDSPFLERQPAVRLQSLSGTGPCLTQADASQPDVTLTTCSRGEGMLEQQWVLELDGTYRNLASKQCLTTDDETGDVLMSSCDAPSLNKQWSWSADRIHSRIAGGNHWRLHVRGGVPHAMFDPARHEVIVANDSHPLLRPWSSYPNKPTPGDVIPRLNTVSPPVPSSYLAYREVSADERWQPVLVRK